MKRKAVTINKQNGQRLLSEPEFGNDTKRLVIRDGIGNKWLALSDEKKIMVNRPQALKRTTRRVSVFEITDRWGRKASLIRNLDEMTIGIKLHTEQWAEVAREWANMASWAGVEELYG